MERFKKEVLEIMLTDTDLYAAIAKEKDVRPGSLTMTIKRNGGSINEYRIVKLVAEYLGRPMESLVEEINEPITK